MSSTDSAVSTDKASAPVSQAAERQRGPAQGGFDRLLGWSLAFFVSLLTLEWVTLGGIGGGFLKPFHLGMGLVAGLALARWRPGLLLVPALRRHGAIYLSYALVLGMGLGGGLAHKVPYLSRTNGLRQASYAAMSLLIAGVLLRAVRRPNVQRALAWAGVVTVSVVTTGLATALAAQHVNPISVLREALVRGDPDVIIYQLLRNAFRSDPNFAEVGANLRHKVFLALLLGVFIGLAFLPALARRARSKRSLVVVGSAVGAALVLLSLSRSAILCLAVPFVLVPLRGLVRRRARSGQMVLTGVLVLVAAALAVSPLADLFLARFSSSGSYDARLEAIGPKFLDEFDNAAFIGAPKPDTPLSPHNLVLDAWLGGGAIAGLAALVMLVAFAWTWLRVARSYVQGGRSWNLPIAQLWVLAIGVIPLVRAVTAGNQFHLIEWTAVAFFLAIVSANHDADPAAEAAVIQERSTHERESPSP